MNPRTIYIAYGSNCELETQILLSGDLGYIKAEEKLKKLQVDIGEVERILKALIKFLENKPLNPFYLYWEKTMHERMERILFTAETIQRRVQDIGKAISSDYQATGAAKDREGRPLIAVCILQGAVMFMADLMRAIEIPVEYDFMSISSYGNSTSPGAVRLLQDLSHPITGRDVLVVEDIIDTGFTANYIKRGLLARNPASFRICTLLDKPFRREEAIKMDYVGFFLEEDLFVVGYGMDYAGIYRNFPHIALLKPEYR